MRLPILASVLLLSATGPAFATDWKAFDDPTTVLLTGAFAKGIAELPAAEKTAAVKRLHDSLAARDVEIRRRAALTLNSLGDNRGVPTMIDDLTKATGRDRDNVVVALRVLKDERAIPGLREALKDKSAYVRGIAVAALGEMKAAKAYDEIVAATKDKEIQNPGGGLNCLRGTPAELACYALGALGDHRAVPILIELVSDKDLQSQAVQALEVLTKQKFGPDAEKWRVWWKGR
jgi:HEAT repeat protein